MHHTSKPGPFPWFSIFSGIVGFSLQCWLFSSRDMKGLLPQNHISQILSILLLALTLAVCFLLLRKAQPYTQYASQFPRSVIAGIGSLTGAVALGYSSISHSGTGFIRIFLPAVGILSACALLVRGYCRIKGMRPHFLLSYTVTLYLLLRSIVCCQTWGAETQLQQHFFQLLAFIALMLTSYYRAELDLGTGNCRRYVFFNQAALLCCCLSIPGERDAFYLLTAIWMTTDSCSLQWS